MDLPAPPDIVVMELPAEHAAQAAEAVESCRLVLGAGRCRASSESGPAPSYFASVKWEPSDSSRVRVEVHREDVDGPLVNAREVEFSPEDTLAHRYRAIGLLVVSHVMADTERSLADSRQSSERATVDNEVSSTLAPPLDIASFTAPSVEGDDPTVEDSKREFGFGVDLGGHVGMGPTGGLSRFGGFLRPWALAFGDSFRPFARLGWIVNSGSVDVDGYEGALGFGLCVRMTSAVSVEVNASGVIQHLRFSAYDPDLGTDRATLTRYGARIGFEGAAELSDHVGLWLGGEVLAANPPYALDVGTERVGEEEGPNWGAVLGLRFRR